ncbi:MAG: TIGR02147 family protein [Fibrobacteres bacterium]|nr:TIGR02147 family protein [Fibrobacterota bacterium]
MNSIYEYSDYRKYLKEYYEFNKAQNGNFSYRYLSMKAGINSASFFKAVIEGERNLTKQTILKTCVAVKLTDKDAEYFENLVFFNQAKSLKEKNVYFDKLIQYQKLKSHKIVNAAEYAFYEEWYHPVIRELAPLIDFKDDFELLASKISPVILPKQAKASVNLLLRLGFLKKERGRYHQTDPVITSGNSIRAHQIVNFQIKMLQRAIEAYESCAVEERMMSSTTVGISKEAFEYFKKKIRELRSHLLEIARTDEKSDRVYQMNINLFPVTKTN